MSRNMHDCLDHRKGAMHMESSISTDRCIVEYFATHVLVQACIGSARTGDGVEPYVHTTRRYCTSAYIFFSLPCGRSTCMKSGCILTHGAGAFGDDNDVGAPYPDAFSVSFNHFGLRLAQISNRIRMSMRFQYYVDI
jgi:hypothetical protein